MAAFVTSQMQRAHCDSDNVGGRRCIDAYLTEQRSRSHYGELTNSITYNRPTANTNTRSSAETEKPRDALYHVSVSYIKPVVFLSWLSMTLNRPLLYTFIRQTRQSTRTRSPAVARMADRTAPLQTIYAKAVVHSCKSVQPFSRNVADKQISNAASCGLPELVPFGNLQGQPYLLLQTVFT